MAKSLRSKREKRLRAIRRELVEPFYDKKEAAKLAALETAFAAPKVPVRTKESNDADGNGDDEMLDSAYNAPTISVSTGLDLEMGESDGGASESCLHPSGGVGKRKWRNIKVGKKSRRHKRKGKKPSFGRKKSKF